MTDKEKIQSALDLMCQKTNTAFAAAKLDAQVRAQLEPGEWRWRLLVDGSDTDFGAMVPGEVEAALLGLLAGMIIGLKRKPQTSE